MCRKKEQKATLSSEQKIKRATTKFNFFFFSFFLLFFFFSSLSYNDIFFFYTCPKTKERGEGERYYTLTTRMGRRGWIVPLPLSSSEMLSVERRGLHRMCMPILHRRARPTHTRRRHQARRSTYGNSRRRSNGTPRCTRGVYPRTRSIPTKSHGLGTRAPSSWRDDFVVVCSEG